MIVSQLRHQTPVPRLILEIGAGEGGLYRKINAALVSTTVTGLDLIGRPANLPGDIGWASGDFFQPLPGTGADACGNSEAACVGLGPSPSANRSVRDCRLCFPRSRSRVGEVTRHDVPASIREVFRLDEPPSLLGLDPKNWEITES